MTAFRTLVPRLPPVNDLYRAFNRLADEVERLSGMTGVGNIVVRQDAAGPTLSLEGLTTGGSLTVKESDGAPIFTDTTTLIVDVAQNLHLSQPAANQVQITVGDCSITEKGVVNLTAQTLGAGVKTFANQTRFNSDARLNRSLSENYLFLDGEEKSYIRQFYAVPGQNHTVTVRAAQDSGGTGRWTQFDVSRTGNFFSLRTSDNFPPFVRVETSAGGFANGVTGTGGGGDTFNGGICTGLGAGSGGSPSKLGSFNSFI